MVIRALFQAVQPTDLPNEERQYRNLQVLPDELRADVPLPQMVWCGGLYQTYENLVMWLSKGGKFSKLHNDFGDFLLHQVDGQKHSLMVDPTQAHLLYYDFPRALHLVGTSGFDPQNVDMRKYPLARNVTIYESTISPGDIMYIPRALVPPRHIPTAGRTQVRRPAEPRVHVPGDHRRGQIRTLVLRHNGPRRP